MKNIFKRVLCCMLSILLVFGSGIVAFAETESDTTPVIVINDIDANPIYNTDDGSVVFNFADHQLDILFTSGFSANILDLFTPEIIEEIQNGDLATLDIAMLLIDYLGFQGDVNKIIDTLLETLLPIIGSMDFSNLDFASIISSIDFEQYAEDLKVRIETAIENMLLIRMKSDGTPAIANIGAIQHFENLEYYYDDDSEAADILAGDIGISIAEEIGYENTYVFTYDWRIDPIKNAALLSEYIDHVKSETGADKVSVISEGYGSTIATTYLAENEDSAADSVKNFVTVSSEFLGTSVVGDIFKDNMVGPLTNITAFTSAYIRYTNDISDNPLTAFATWMFNYMLNNEWELQSFCFEVEKILATANYVVQESGIINEVAKMPGMWALVPVNDYDEAVENIFTDSANDKLFEAIDTYKNYQIDYESILLAAKDSGINVSVVAAWDLQIIPTGKNYNVQSDGIVDTEYASFGATCVDLNDVAEAKDVEQMYEDNHKHVSTTYDMLTPWYAHAGICKYIDASTCALPENTWFIKNMKHGTFSWESNSVDFLIWLVTADEERTVWQDAAYKQFMTYNRYINPGILSSDGFVPDDNSQPGGYLLGDINLDGAVTSLDAKIALCVANEEEYLDYDSIPFRNADINADGEITTDDAAAILFMSAGIVKNMQSGIKFTYDAQQGSMDVASYEIELRPEYNSVKNQIVITAVVLDAEGSCNGNFIVNYDTEMFEYADAKMFQFENGYTAGGCPTEGVLSFAYASSEEITDEECTEDGDLVVAVFYLNVSREIKPTAVSAGASYFYENDELAFVEPIALDLDEDFFLMLGDADDNRYLSAQDARKVLRIASRLDKVTDDKMFERCDVDKDNKITAKDARLVLRASAKLIDSY